MKLAGVFLTGGAGYLSYKYYLSSIKLPYDLACSFEEYCVGRGYFVQTHHVTTEDGYKLKLYRLASKEANFKKQLPPILMVHGLTHTARTFVINQSTKAPAFRLAEENYDIWLLNTRGNYESREHVSLSPQSFEYWNWCSNHIGHFDLPVSIDYILQCTQYPKLNYIGHSQGAIVAYYCFSRRPEFGEKVNLAFMMGGGGGKLTVNVAYLKPLLSSEYIENCKKKGLFLLADYPKNTEKARFAMAFPYYASEQYRCKFNIQYGGEDPKVIAYYEQNLTGGTSIVNLDYLRQIHERGSVIPICYDYGPEINKEKYGQEFPPTIDYSQICTKLAIMGAKYDLIITEEDLRAQIDALPSERIVFAKTDYEIDHFGFAVSKNQAHIDDVIRLLKEYPIV